MATVLTVQELPANSAPVAVTYAACDTDGMSAFNDGAMYVVLKGGASPAAGGVSILATPSMDAGRDIPRALTVSANGTSYAGPFKQRNWNSGLYINITCADATDLTIAVVRIPQ